MIPSNPESNIHSTDSASLDAQLEALASPLPAHSSAPPAQLLAAARRERSARRATATVCAVPALLALGLVFTQFGPRAPTSPKTSPETSTPPQLALAPSVDLPPTTTLAAITLANAEGPITLGTLCLPTGVPSSSTTRSEERTFRVLDHRF